jgi:hypothetical protein
VACDRLPNYAAGLNYPRPRDDGVPTGVNLPTYLAEARRLAGQYAVSVRGVTTWQSLATARLPHGRHAAAAMEVDRRGSRASGRQSPAAGDGGTGGERGSDQQHVRGADSPRARAFEMDREPAAVRDRYGRHAFGQSLLLARRLVQAGVRVVQANMGRVQNWDTHGDNFRRLKRDLLPPLDQGVSALLDDLGASGLLDETLVVVVGEFGRTPKISGTGRDHWAQCFSGVFAGAGVRGGQVIGRSDRIGAYPATTPYSPDDVGATVYHVLGVDPASEVRDRQDRPVQLNRGSVLQGLFTGVSA